MNIKVVSEPSKPTIKRQDTVQYEPPTLILEASSDSTPTPSPSRFRRWNRRKSRAGGADWVAMAPPATRRFITGVWLRVTSSGFCLCSLLSSFASTIHDPGVLPSPSSSAIRIWEGNDDSLGQTTPARCWTRPTQATLLAKPDRKSEACAFKHNKLEIQEARARK